jgi:hypothetical protein
MDWLSFIAAVIGSLAWPAVVLGIFIALRKPLRDLIPLLVRLRYKDLELDFARELRKVESEAREALPIPAPTPKALPNPEPRDAIQLLAQAESLSSEFPEAAVAVGWSAVESELMAAVMRLAVSPDYPPDNSARKNAHLLASSGAISEKTLSVLERMRNLRNLAVHGSSRHIGPGPVSPDEAREFIALASGIVQELRKARR